MTFCYWLSESRGPGMAEESFVLGWNPTSQSETWGTRDDSLGDPMRRPIKLSLID